MYNKFFGFKEKPFKLVPNPEYLFLSKSHEEALAHLTYAISQGDGFVELTGEVGTGKTTLCRVFLENLDKSIEAAYVFNPKLDALQLLKAINDEFGIDSKPDNTKDLIDRLNEFLINKKGAGEKTLVLIDEAQNLSHEVLEQLRLLSNLETTQDKLLQIILVGQPELGDMLSSHQLRQLGQRITINCQLAPLTFVETKDYIRHRIALASHRAGPPFDKASYRAIYDYSKGVPRLINIACDRALLNAFSRNSFKVTASITREAIKELTRQKAAHSYNWLQWPSGLAILSAVIIPLVAIMLYLANGQSPKPPDNILKPAPLPEHILQVNTPRAIAEDKEEVPEISAPTEQPEAEAPAVVSTPLSQTAEPKADKPDTLPLDSPVTSPPPEKPVVKVETPLIPEHIELEPDEYKVDFQPLAANFEEPEENISADSVFHSVHVGAFESSAQAKERLEELKSLGYPSFMYKQENSSGSTVYPVVAGKYPTYDLAKVAGRSLSRAGYKNFIARAKHSLNAEPGFNVQKSLVDIDAQPLKRPPQSSEEAHNFLNYLKGLNSRFSRNNSMEQILKIWLPNGNIKIKQKRIDSDRFFFREAAKQYGLQVQPVATESDLQLIQNLNVPAIFTFYLVGHSWPKYLAVSSMDKDTIYFVDGKQNKPISVEKRVFHKYWSGEAYIFWKNFKHLNAMITQESSGQDIKNLKKLLLNLGYNNITLTAKYDDQTIKIIKDIQTKYGLHVDGLSGPLTQIALYNEANGFVKPSLNKLAVIKTENGS